MQQQTPQAAGLPVAWNAQEPAWKRWVFVALAGMVVGLFAYQAAVFWVPAHPGVDQNGYLVGARQFADTLTMKLVPTRAGSQEFDPHGFVGRMWVGVDYATPDERFYPKYPLGLPALYALAIWIGRLFSHDLAVHLVYLVNPLAMTLAVVGTFLLVRAVAGSFAALLATIVLATSPVTMGLTTNPNSHATTLACVVWGMYLLIRWWESQGLWRAMGAGLLLGFAATIRYTEGALILPVVLVILFNLRLRDLLSWRDSGALLLAWSLPVALLLIYNQAAMGTWTGYDPTNESGGFRWEYAADNWETMIRHLNTNGLALLLPISLAGLTWMIWWNWRLAAVLWAWVLPCILIYTFYYWAPDGSAIGYLRFFLTILPALALGAFWLVHWLDVRWQELKPDVRAWHAASAVMGAAVALVLVKLATTWWEGELSIPAIVFILCFVAAGALLATLGKPALAPFGAGVLGAIVTASHLSNAIPLAEADHYQRLSLKDSTSQIMRVAPAGSVVITPDTRFLHHLQFVADYALYQGDTFNRAAMARLRLDEEQTSDPQGLDPGRRMALHQRLGHLTQEELDEQFRALVRTSLDRNRRVFLVIPRRPANDPLPRWLGGDPSRRALPEPWRRMLRSDLFVTEVQGIWNTVLVRPAPPGRMPRRQGWPVQRPGRPDFFQIIEIRRAS